MKRNLMWVVLILVLAVAVNAIETLTTTEYFNLPNKENPLNGMRKYVMAAKWLNAAGACTTSAMDAHGFKYWATYLERHTDGDCDSAHLNIERQRSLNGTDWVKVDSLPYAGKHADTLGVITDWVGTATIDPALYYRFILRAEAATNESTYVEEFIIVGQQ